MREYLEGGYVMWGKYRLVSAEFLFNLYIFLSILFVCCWICMDFVVHPLFCIIALLLYMVNHMFICIYSMQQFH